MAKRIGPVIATIGSDTKGFTDGLTKSQKALQQFSSTAAIAGVRASAAFAATFGAISAFSIKVGSEFELAFANVKKTVEGTPEQFQALEQSIRETSKTFGIAATEIADLARIGGQLGVATEDLDQFSEVIAKLSIAAAELDPEAAARGLARLAALSGEGVEGIEKMANVIAKLGDSLPTTESRILDFSTRLASFGSAVGLTSEQIIGLAAGFSALVGGTERAATSVERFLGEMAQAVAAQGPELDAFAELASSALGSAIKNTEDFVKVFESAPIEAIESVIGGMEQLGKEGLAPLLNKFDELGISGVRMLSTFAAGAKGADKLREALAVAAQEAAKQTKLNKELAIQLDTVARQFDRLKVALVDVGIELFQAFRDEIMFIIQAGMAFVGALSSIASFVKDLGTVVQFAIIGVVGLTGAMAALLVVLGTVGGLVAGLSALFTTMLTALAGTGVGATLAASGLVTYSAATGTATLATGVLTATLGTLASGFLAIAAPIAIVLGLGAAIAEVFNDMVIQTENLPGPIADAAEELGFFGRILEVGKIGVEAISEAYQAWQNTSDAAVDATRNLAAEIGVTGEQFDTFTGFVRRAIGEYLQLVTGTTLLVAAYTKLRMVTIEGNAAQQEATRAAAEAALAQSLAAAQGISLAEAEALIAQNAKIASDRLTEVAVANQELADSGQLVAKNMNDQIAKFIQASAEGDRLKDIQKGLGIETEQMAKLAKEGGEQFLVLAESQIAAAEAAKKHKEEMDRLRDSLRGDTLGVVTQNFQNFAQVVRETMDGNVALTDKGVVDMVKRLQELADVAGVELPADLKAFSDAVDETIGRQLAVAEAAKTAREEMAGLGMEAAAIDFEGFQQGLIEAIETGEKFSIESTIEIFNRMKEGAAKSGQAVVAELKSFMNKAQLVASIGLLIPVKVDLPDDVDLLAGIDFGGDDGEILSLPEGLGGLPSDVEFLGGQLKELKKENKEWNDSLAATVDIMSILGLGADSTFGRIIGGFTIAAKSGSDFKKQLTSARLEFAKFREEQQAQGKGGGIGSFLSEGGGVSAGIQMGGSILTGITGVIEAGAGGGIKGALGGALAGGKLGADIGGMFGPIGSIAGGVIGAGIGAAISLFRGKPEFVKIMEDVGERWGTEISEELAKEIEATAERLDIGRFEASLLSLGDVIGEAGSVAAFGLENTTVAVNDLMNAIASGAVPAAEGIEELGTVFGQMASEMFEAGTIADAAMLQVIDRARELGLEVPEIAAFIGEQLAQAAAGITQIIGSALEDEDTGEVTFGGIQVATLEDAQAQATIFAAGFFAMLDEVGLREAVDTFGPAFAEMKKKMEAFGSDVNFGGVERLFNIAQDPKFGPLLDGVQGLKDGMTGLANAGFLTTETFSAFQQQGAAAFAQMQELGLNSKDSLQQMAPFLQEAINASQTFGFELDQNTQDMIAQAEAAGIGFATDPMTQMVDVLALIAEQLGVTQEALSGVGVGAQEAGTAVEEALGPDGGLGTAAEGFDEMKNRSDEAYNDMVDGARQAGEEISTSLGNGATEAGEAGVEAAAGVAASWDEATAALGVGFDEQTGKIVEDYQMVDEATAQTGDAVVSLGDQAISAAAGFDMMAAAANKAATAASNAAGAGGGAPTQAGQFGLTSTVNEPTTFIAGEAGEETVTIDPGGGGAGQGGPSVVVLQIDGKTIGKVLGDLSRTGDVRIHPSAVKDFG